MPPFPSVPTPSSHGVGTPAFQDDPRNQVAIALDFPSASEALELVDRLGSLCRWVKVGLELFYAEGPPLVRALRERHLQVFLDLKLHDIPNTVASAVRSLAQLDVQLLTIHALGGPEMLALAQSTTEQCGGPSLLAVTVLTSMDAAQLQAIGLGSQPEDHVLQLARLAQNAGLSGLVCSPREAQAIRHALGNDPLLVTPGIRQTHAPSDDQKRTTTATEAIRNGASLLVIGRPVTRAAEPKVAFTSILEEIRTAKS